MPTTTTTKLSADEIVAKHGCEIQPAAFGGVAVVPVAVTKKGELLDRPRVQRAIEDCRSAGYDTSRWLVGA